MLIPVEQMPHKGGTEFLNPEAIVRVTPLEYMDKDKLYDGCLIMLEGGITMESCEAAEDIAERANNPHGSEEAADLVE